MKIALVTRDYTSRGGLERVSQFYARTFAAHGHDVHVWYGNADLTEQDHDIDFHRIKTPVSKGWLFCLMFGLLAGSKVKASDYDAVIVIGVAGVCPDSYIVANSVHLNWFKTSLRALPFFSPRWFLKALNPLHYSVIFLEWLQYKRNRFAKTIAVSEPIRDELLSCYGISKNQIELLPNGADLDLFEPNSKVRERTRSELGVASDELLMCMLVNELERKGVRQTIQALKQVNNPKLKLLIVAKQNEAASALAESLDAQNSVLVRPNTPDARPFLWASDLYVLPTVYEAWNLSIMEAHASGLPIVTTRLGQADQIVLPGKTGFLIEDPKDVHELSAAIQKWLECPDKNQMSLDARERMQPYSWSAIVTQFERFIGSSINRSKKVLQPASK